MKTYEIQVKNPMVTSIKETVKADSVISAKNKARDIFLFKGNEKYIIVNELLTTK